MTVLVTGAGAPGAPGVIKSLRTVKERRIRIIGVDMKKEAIGFLMVDKAYLVPPASGKNFINRVLEICKREKVDVIVPLVTKELMKFSKNKGRFKKIGTSISTSNFQGLKVANNKYLLLKHCKKIGVPTPKFIKVNSYEQFKKAVFSLGYPHKKVCFKPPTLSGSRGFRILAKGIDRLNALINEKPTNTITTFEDIALILKRVSKFPQLIVMEYLPGKQYTVNLLANNGVPVISVSRLIEDQKLSIDWISTIVENQTIIDASERIVHTLRLSGNIGIQYAEDDVGIPRVIECNPRIEATIELCTAADVNLVYLAVKLALGEKVIPPKVKWGTKIIRYWDGIHVRGKNAFGIKLHGGKNI